MSKEGAAAAVPKVECALHKRDIETALDEDPARELGREGEAMPTAELVDWADMLIALGGDGTLLNAATGMNGNPKPVAGVNIGTLGFLTFGTAEEIEAVAGLLAAGDFVLSHRAMLSAEVFGGENGSAGPHFALNEVTMSRGRESRIVRLETSIGGEFLTTYNADGLIVSTPTGSTAYSLSAGGPIIAPESGVLALTPICPHALSNRSLVVSGSSEVEIRPLDEDGEVLLAMDGRTIQRIRAEMSVKISQSERTLPLVMKEDHTFYDTLRQKLRWHGSNV